MTLRGVSLPLACIVAVTVVVYCVVGVGAKLELVNNGYEGVVILIKDTVKEDPDLIDSIKEIFTEASSVLFNATKHRAYFRDVTIVVPKKWRKSQRYQEIPAANVFYEHIRVDRKNKAKGNAPYVRGNMECGKPAWYLHLTPKFLKNDIKRYGPQAKAVVHEWGHLRWGLFDEYGSIQHPKSTKPNHKIHFYTKNGEWHPVTCVKEIEGEAYKGCKRSKPCKTKSLKMPPSCKFCPKKKQKDVKASMMAFQWIPGVDSFCDVDSNTTDPSVRHDSTVPNMQNKMCGGKSAWEVMREHEDFREGHNPQISPQTNTTPSFRIVQETGRVRVLVFDTSGSMKGEKIIQQKRAASLAIDTIVEKGSKLGIVRFDSYGSVEAPVAIIKGKKSKRSFKDKIPTIAGGGTEILHGVRKAIQALEASGNPLKGSEIILLSDGESNHKYLDVLRDLKQRGIVVNTIAVTDQADRNLAKLAKNTGGHSFTYLETSTVSFADVLSQAMQSGPTDSDTPVKIFNKELDMTPGRNLSGTFEVEQGLGMDTSITAMLNVTGYFLIGINVTAPNGSMYHIEEFSDLVTLDIPDYSEPGEYRYLITINSTKPVSVSITATSTQASIEDDVVRVTSYLSTDTIDYTSAQGKEIILYANVEKGGNPVLNATVEALLAGDQVFEPITLMLHDSGTGADTSSSDGIYSAFVLRKFFTGNSRYNIKLFVTSEDGAFTYTTDVNSGSNVATVPGEEDDEDGVELVEEKTARFRREVISGEITVTNFKAVQGDVTPPAKITDLSVENIRYTGEGDSKAIVFSLQWTAVGDDMDEGTATEYKMRMHKDPGTLRQSFSDLPPLLYQARPKPSGQSETRDLNLTRLDCNNTCYIALSALDEKGNQGEISNIINVDVNFSYIVDDDVDDDDDDDNGSDVQVVEFRILENAANSVAVSAALLCAMLVLSVMWFN